MHLQAQKYATVSHGNLSVQRAGKENPTCVDCGSLKTALLTPADPSLSGAGGGGSGGGLNGKTVLFKLKTSAVVVD